MANVLIVYHSYRGITPKMVEALEEGIKKAGGQSTTLKANEAKPEDLLAADTIVLASGQPFGSLAGPVKTFLESCWIYEGKDQFAGKKYALMLNGARDQKDVTVYLDNILPYFKLQKAAEAVTCLANEVDITLEKCSELGEQLGQA